MRLTCPECGSEEITFGKDHTVYRCWEQDGDGPTLWEDYDEGSAHEIDDKPIECWCRSCKHKWKVEGVVEDYTE